jgi:hypothetical protein
MDVCVYSVFLIGSGLASGWSPPESPTDCLRLRNLIETRVSWMTYALSRSNGIRKGRRRRGRRGERRKIGGRRGRGGRRERRRRRRGRGGERRRRERRRRRGRGGRSSSVT